MPKTTGYILIGVAILVLLIFMGSPLYVVNEGTQVVITRFGDPVSGAITNTGLHIKVPFVDVVNRFERRVLEWDGDPNQVPTKDKRFIWIDTTARWKITDPLKFLQSVDNETGAQARLDDIVDAVTRDVITEQLLIEIVRSSNRIIDSGDGVDKTGTDRLLKIEKIKLGRNALTREILSRASTMTPRYGIELIDMRVKRIIYVNEVLEKIYERMITERQRVAEGFRSEGRGRQAEIEGRTEKDLDSIRSEAYRKSEEIKGKADAEATRIYAEVYGKDPDFYQFIKTLDTYETSIDENSTLVLTTESEYFQYLKHSGYKE